MKMAYKSLYRTYRPQTFKDVAGQEAIITTLKHAIDEKKIAHAYLFCGPRGTGKTTVAKLLAKAVNCTGDPKPCGECENCKQIENGTHPDVIEIDAASNNGVEEVRSLIDKVKYAPTQGHIPSGVPYVGVAREDILAGKIKNAMIIGKGSLFLGRMTNLFDGVSFVIQANTGAEDNSGVSEEEVKGLIAKAMKDFAASLMATEE